MAREPVNLTDLSPSVHEPTLCSLPGCDRPLRRKSKIYCSASHRTKAWQLRKAAKTAERKRRRSEAQKRKGSWMSQDPFALFDYLPRAERQAVFLEAAGRVLRKRNE